MGQSTEIAFVQDDLPYRGGAEKLLEAALEVFPHAPVYTLVYNRHTFEDTPLKNHEIHTSFIDKLPGAHKNHRYYLPLMPLAVEQFDLRAYPIIVSFSYAVAHGIIPRPDQLHISYTHTVLRYAWQNYHDYVGRPGHKVGPIAWVERLILHYLRVWDLAASRRVDHFVANSSWMARCIWRAYRRRADVLYPPVEIEKFKPLLPREDYFIVVSRLVPHKRIDMIIEAFAALQLPLLIVGVGPEFKKLSHQAPANVKFLGWQPESAVAELLGRARAFIQAGEEDFGIAQIEAQAAGCPVITSDCGAAHEIVKDGVTGVFYSEQSSAALVKAVQQFNAMQNNFDPAIIHQSSIRFDKERFQRRFAEIIQRDWDLFNQGRRNFNNRHKSGIPVNDVDQVLVSNPGG
jgi:glycosyltransferase involved in cell wall biosynthesis